MGRLGLGLVVGNLSGSGAEQVALWSGFARCGESSSLIHVRVVFGLLVYKHDVQLVSPALHRTESLYNYS